jgi:hypothetical protein
MGQMFLISSEKEFQDRHGGHLSRVGLLMQSKVKAKGKGKYNFHIFKLERLKKEYCAGSQN